MSAKCGYQEADKASQLITIAIYYMMNLGSLEMEEGELGCIYRVTFPGEV